MSVPVIEAGWVSCPRCSRRARAGQPFCESCGERLASPESAESSDEERRTLTCQDCGAASRIPAGERTGTCPFCGAVYVARGELGAERIPPEFILPFTVNKARAEESFREWLGRFALFVPGDLQKRSSVEKLRGVYVPFWSFSMRSDSVWSARIGEHWYETVTESYTTTENGKLVTKTRTRRVQHTEWYPLDGRFHQFHSHHLVCASKGLTPESARRIQPFPIGELTRYAPHYLAGWIAEEYAVGRETALAESREEFLERERHAIHEFLPGDTSSDLEITTEFSDETEDLVLLPLWIFAFRYREKAYQYLLNGATGEGHGDKPLSALRIAVFILVMVAIIAAVIVIALVAGGRG